MKIQVVYGLALMLVKVPGFGICVEMKFRDPEYYQVHGPRLAAIAHKVDNLVESFTGDRIVATKQPGDETATLIAGGP